MCGELTFQSFVDNFKSYLANDFLRGRIDGVEGLAALGVDEGVVDKQLGVLDSGLHDTEL